MESREEVSWDEAISSGSYIKLEEGVRKTLILKNWRNEKVANRFKKSHEDPDVVVEFTADVIEEDGEAVEKTWTSTSNRLKKALRTVLEKMDKTLPTKLSVKKIGDKFATTYDVELL